MENQIERKKIKRFPKLVWNKHAANRQGQNVGGF